jgi:hypothetical protein
MKINKRYIIDERVGCIAVIDTTKIFSKTTKFHSPGLHDDTLGVVKRWQGIFDHDWYRWNIPRQYLKEAYELCERLNKGGNR